MGLDTYVFRSKSAADTFNTNANGDWKECLYWRKCWSLDNYLRIKSTDALENDGYTAVVPFEALEELYHLTGAKIADILEAVNSFKRFPFSNVDTIDKLEDYDSAFECEEMGVLWDVIEEIAGELFTDSIWGAVTALRTTYNQLKELMAEPDAAEYNYVWLSSF